MGNLGKRLTVSLLAHKDLSVLSSQNVSGKDLFDDGLKTFKWLLKFYDDYKEWPSQSNIEESTGVSLPREVDPLPYITNKVRERSLGKLIERGILSAAKALEERKPDEADNIIKKLAKESRKIIIPEVISYRGDADKRIEEYDKAKLHGGYLGIATPWKSLDKIIQGFVDGSLTVFTAVANTGKTWILIICAEYALSLEKKVLFITLEMPTSRITRRLDAVRYKIPFANLRDILLDSETEVRLKKAILEDEVKGDIIFADKRMIQTVRDVESLVHIHEPDIVFIDGGYRFRGDKSSEWESSKTIVAELQTASEITNIPWVVSTQHGDSNETGKTPKKGPKMRAWGVRYAKEWVINPDICIGLYQDTDMRLLEKLDMYFLKVREGVGGSSSEVTISWDMKNMKFTEIEDTSSLVSF